MYPYSYEVSLRLWHPSRNLAAATKIFGVRPWRSWKCGEPRTTPRGTAMSGTYPNSYWTARLTDGKGKSKQEHIERFLSRHVLRFSKARAFLSRLRSSGGRAELFVGLYGSRNFAVEMPPELMKSAARLGVAFTFDIYPT